MAHHGGFLRVYTLSIERRNFLAHNRWLQRKILIENPYFFIESLFRVMYWGLRNMLGRNKWLILQWIWHIMINWNHYKWSIKNHYNSFSMIIFPSDYMRCHPIITPEEISQPIIPDTKEKFDWKSLIFDQNSPFESSIMGWEISSLHWQSVDAGV